MDRERGGLPISSLREVAILSKIKHVNVVRLFEVVAGRDLSSVYLVLEYCDQDLGHLVDTLPVPFTEPQVKCLMLQLCHGMAHLHAHYIIHRDLKLPNILLTRHGVLKIADFGMARR